MRACPLSIAVVCSSIAAFLQASISVGGDVAPPSVTCPTQDSAVDVLYANPKDCSTYYQCRQRVPVLLPCPTGLQWNDDIKLCDYPPTEACKGTTLPKGPRITETNDFIPDSVIERCMRSPEGTMLADPEDCAGFYVCSSGVPYSKTCRPGLLYHDSLHVCDWPENVDCCENGGETPEVTTAPKPDPTVDPNIPQSCSPDINYIPHFEDCTSYYQCDGEQHPVLHKCPDSLFWNQDSEMCDFPENTTCYVL